MPFRNTVAAVTAAAVFSLVTSASASTLIGSTVIGNLFGTLTPTIPLGSATVGAGSEFTPDLGQDDRVFFDIDFGATTLDFDLVDVQDLGANGIPADVIAGGGGGGTLTQSYQFIGISSFSATLTGTPGVGNLTQSDITVLGNTLLLDLTDVTFNTVGGTPPLSGFDVSFSNVVVPLPAPVLLLLSGIAGLGIVARKKKTA
ncbi:MAG: VPLPA-CTERM sorting domain-containing protein [Pseudomonadota bacterium]